MTARPVITSISPATIFAATRGVSITIGGSGFDCICRPGHCHEGDCG
ncbi:MAG: IPT/TIG domain-containing protein [Bryobacteraceae bacterium]